MALPTLNPPIPNLFNEKLFRPPNHPKNLSFLKPQTGNFKVPLACVYFSIPPPPPRLSKMALPAKQLFALLVCLWIACAVLPENLG